jgi:ADP-heptose:LPS heptosyltransferase
VAQGKELLKEAGLEPDRKIIVIQPGSGGVNKCWHIDNFLAIAKMLDSEGIGVIFLLGPAELDRFNGTTIKKISSVAKYLTDLSMPQVLGLLSCANAFIGNDSGVTHLAAALGTKTLAVFGPTNSTVYRPIGQNVRVFKEDTPNFATKPSPSLQRELLDLLTTHESL